MMSEFIIGMLFMKLTVWRALFLKLNIPMAAMLPKRVDIAEAIRAMAKVFPIAPTNECCTFPAKRELYSFKEKPVQLPNTFASVNEKNMIMAIGK